MSDPIVTLEPTELTVEPGGQIRTQVTVRNPGTVVEGYRIEVLGERPDQGPPTWAQVYPPELRVFPKETGTAMIVFAPPAAGSTAGGSFAFGVKVASSVDAERTAVAEGDLEVGRVFGLQATITPLTSSGRWRGYHVIKYTNWGNTSVRLRLKASDPDERLGFFLRPDEVDLPLGGKAEARLTVRTRKPFLRGQPARLPFEVVGEQDGMPQRQPAHPMVSDPGRPVVNGALMQKPIISRVVVMLAVACLALLAGALVLAFKTPQKKQTFESEGTPSPPTALAAKAVKNGAIQLDWHPAQDVSGYKVLVFQGSTQVGSSEIPDGAQGRFLTTALGLAPSTLYCFKLESLRGKKQSSDSRAVCQTTPAPPKPSTSGSPTGSSGGGTGGQDKSGAPSSSGAGASSGASGSSSAPGSGSSTGPPVQPIAIGQSILICDPLFPDTDPKAQQKAADYADTLSTRLAARALHSTDYPKWMYRGHPIVRPFWAAYFGPFNSTIEGGTIQGNLATNGVTCRFSFPAG
ncbi:MAG TPA: fibronectin type III domain-containing protein [Jatrophihabitans sp.]|nr:fibronectin type III domain-containing protein [Jatrophihabitans sp.]